MTAAAFQVLRRATGVALFTFLCFLAGAAVLVVSARLQVAGLGATAGPGTWFRATLIVALGSTGTPVSFAGARITVVPLGLVILVLLAVARASRRRQAPELRRELAAAATTGPLFALLLALVARAGRISTSEIEVSSAAAGAAGLAWGSVAGVVAALPALRADRARRTFAARAPELWGAVAGARMWAVATALGAPGALVAAGFAHARSSSLGAGETAGLGLQVLALLPNLATSVLSLALGAPVEVSRGLGDGNETAFSLLDWGGGPTPAYAAASVLAPLVAGIVAGRWLRARLHRAPAFRFVVAGALAFAALAAAGAALSSARIAIDPGADRVLALAASIPATGALGLPFAAVTLCIGWSSASPRRPTWRDLT